MAKKKDRFRAEYYQSEASARGPHAASPEESLWAPAPHTTYEQALKQAKHWTTEGNFKTTRVVEVDKYGEPESVHWMSVWEKPYDHDDDDEDEGGVPTGDGVSCKLIVWMDRDAGPPDHWDTLRRQLETILDGNNNCWELAYGREVDRTGKKIRWSLRINIWDPQQRDPSGWTWTIILGIPEENKSDVEFVRATPIGPREFPAGASTDDCAFCDRRHLASTSWHAYNPDNDMTEAFCSCYCVDQQLGTDAYRQTPDGEEREGPGCVVQEAAPVELPF